MKWSLCFFVLCVCVLGALSGRASVDLMVDSAEELKEMHDKVKGVSGRNDSDESLGAMMANTLKSFESKQPALEYLHQQTPTTPIESREYASVDLIVDDEDELENLHEAMGASYQKKASEKPLTTLMKDTLGDFENKRKQARKVRQAMDPGKLNGIIFVSMDEFVSSANIAELYEHDLNYQDQKIQVIGFEDKTLRKVVESSFPHLRGYLGQPIDVPLLDNIISHVKANVRNSQMPFVNIYAPPQNIEHGVVYVVIKLAVVEDIKLAESQYFDEKRLLKGVSQGLAEPINVKALERDLALLSLHPDRELKASFSPGGIDNTTVINLDIEERKPWRVYASTSNNGAKNLDRQQVTVGGYHNNLWGLDHQAFYQYTTSADLEQLKAHNLEYIVPYWGRHSVSLQYARSETQASILNNTFNTEGTFSQLSLMHNSAILSPMFFMDDWSVFEQKIGAGVNHKRIKGDVLFTLFGAPESTGVGANVEVYNGILEYAGKLQDPYKGISDFSLSLTHSPGGLSRKNENENFETARANAKATYTYARLKADRVMPISIEQVEKDLFLKTGFNAQYSADRLIGSEKFISAHRPGSRGYDSGVFSGDSGVSGYVEVETSPYTLISKPHYLDSLSASIFVDGALFYNNDAISTEDDEVGVLSVGTSLKYRINDRINSELTFSQDISGKSEDTNQRVMYNLMFNY